MIIAAVVCPHPPLLFRELSGARDAVPELRAACHEALASALASRPDVVVVVGGAAEGGEWDAALPADVHGFGTADRPARAGTGRTLPLSLGVGRRLLEEAGWDGSVQYHSLPWGADAAAVADLARTVGKVEGDVVLLVLGDGSTRRGEKAPGYLDERAFAFDDVIVSALADGDSEALTRLDPDLAEELMVLGRTAFGVLGEVVTTQDVRPRARLLYRDDPYGVQYTVAVWELAGPGAATRAEATTRRRRPPAAG